MRAVSHDVVTAGLMGVNVNAVISFTFGLGGGARGCRGGALRDRLSQINTSWG